jgi:hypothetical protein
LASTGTVIPGFIATIGKPSSSVGKANFLGFLPVCIDSVEVHTLVTARLAFLGFQILLGIDDFETLLGHTVVVIISRPYLKRPLGTFD